MRIPITHLKLLTLFLFLPCLAWAQTTVSGKISDEKGEGIPFATIIEEGTSTGTTTDIEGNFEFNVSKLPTVLAVSYIGYKTKKETVTSAGNIAITLMQDNFGLDEIVVTGQGTKPRTILDSPVPVDNFGVKELTTSGKPTLDKMLMFKVPSFNSSNQAISDATAHYDPADLRGLGPSRTLVLINGKRKNQSAQVYLNRTPGKGEVGVDLKSIPTAAIERVEVLRDGASAQYGSDAIGGVINMILKKNVEYTTVTATTGITSKGDGFTVGADLNTAFDFGDGGYVNLTLGYYKQDITNRAGTPGLADLPGAPQEDGFEDTVDDNGNVTTANQNYNDALDVYDTNMITWTKWATENPDLGMHVGQPAMEKVDIFVNMSHPLGEYGEFYTFHGFTTRTGQSFAYYRAPYWRNDVAEAGFLTKPEDFVGYQPTFEAKINDHINVMGVKYDLGGNWNADVSATYGANSVDYTVNNSVNRDYLADNGTSPTTFHPGGYRLQNAIGNLSVSGPLVENINVSTGLEYKKEYFDAFQGDPFSYYKGGSDSFAGVKPAEAGSWDRNNFAAFALVDYDITDALLFGAAARYEDYSDFGDNFSFKVNGRYKLV